MPDETIDLTRGIYRRLYANFIVGRRINSVSLEAEAWFWRIISVADDFGNLSGDVDLIYVATVGRRVSSGGGRASPVTVEQVRGWTTELIEIGLLDRYEAGADVFLHVRGYLTSQAAGINGKRVRRVKAWPGEESERGRVSTWDAERVRVNPGESKRGRVKPGGNLNDEPEPKPEPEAAAARAGAVGETPGVSATSPGPAAAAAEGLSVPISESKEEARVLPELLAALQGEFPELHVVGEIRALASHLRSKPEARMAEARLRECIVKWLNRSMAHPHLRQKPAMAGTVATNIAARETAMDRKRRELDASLAASAGGRA